MGNSQKHTKRLLVHFTVVSRNCLPLSSAFISDHIPECFLRNSNIFAWFWSELIVICCCYFSFGSARDWTQSLDMLSEHPTIELQPLPCWLFMDKFLLTVNSISFLCLPRVVITNLYLMPSRAICSFKIFLCVYVCTRICWHLWIQRGVSGLLKLGLQVVVNCPTWTLGNGTLVVWKSSKCF